MDAAASNAASVRRMSSLTRASRAARPLFGDWTGGAGGTNAAVGTGASPVMRRARDTPATDPQAGAAWARFPRPFSRCSRFRRALGRRRVDAVSYDRDVEGTGSGSARSSRCGTRTTSSSDCDAVGASAPQASP